MFLLLFSLKISSNVTYVLSLILLQYMYIIRAVGFKNRPGHETSKSFHGGGGHKSGFISLSLRGLSPEKSF